MKLPHCSRCNYFFKWRELLIGFGQRKCPECGAYQYITAQKRRQGMWIGPAAALGTVVIVQLVDPPFSVLWPFAVLVVILAILVNPFFLEFTEKEEPLF
ncbi:TIGR04104 family putative zinc finger protein [Alkalicoccus halolimnae]|uniref:TIGR04104 family putative zinc finger protein n=1 Tax=Alkalicoccus halolimnae TaxID=1667239 RepID=A0A5C7FFW8_9BACI|nr:TIGR04104 family putative zinc finger protein [Alkalicoccus halolimnae]TXF81830.1 hypothetical protein FTX54_15420 [Alkalicoccus halolimnae]